MAEAEPTLPSFPNLTFKLFVPIPISTSIVQHTFVCVDAWEGAERIDGQQRQWRSGYIPSAPHSYVLLQQPQVQAGHSQARQKNKIIIIYYFANV